MKKRPSEMFEILLCDPEGRVVVGSDPEKIDLQLAIDEVKALERFVLGENKGRKVFCRDCWYFKEGEYGSWCSKVIGVVESAAEKRPKTISEYEKWNVDNDCGHFEESGSIQFKKFIKQKIQQFKDWILTLD